MVREQMPRLVAATFRLEPEILDGLDKVKVRDGIPHSEQVRRALKAWLKARRVLSAAPKRSAR
jgi:hypothetical protein